MLCVRVLAWVIFSGKSLGYEQSGAVEVRYQARDPVVAEAASYAIRKHKVKVKYLSGSKVG